MKVQTDAKKRPLIRPVVESPAPIYAAGVSVGIGCGVLILLILLGAVGV